MKTCSDFEELAARACGETLSADDATALAEHVAGCVSCREFQRAVGEDDRRLEAFAEPLAVAAQRVAAATLEHMEPRRVTVREMTAPPAGRRWRRYVPAAAAVILATGLIWLTSGRSVYAQVEANLARVQSLHFTGKSLEDGKWVTAAEGWYDRALGVVERETRGEQTSMLIDDGKRQLTYSSGSKFAVESGSGDTHRLVAKLLNLLEFRKVFDGKPAGTIAIDGHTCNIYETSPSPEAKVKTRAFLDEDAKLIRGWEKFRMTDAGAWEKYRTAAVDYNVPVGKEVFKPDLPAGVVIVDAKQWEVRFALDKALETKQILGIDIAVHDIQRCDNGAIFVVVSSRPGPEVVKQYGRIDSRAGQGSTSHGDFSFGSAYQRLAGDGYRSYQPMSLARLYHNGMIIEWELLIPRGTWPQPIRELPLDVSVHTRNQLQKDIQARNDPSDKRESLAVKVPDAKVPLAELAARIHEQTAAMEGAAFQVSLDLGFEPPNADGGMMMKSKAPHAISAEEYVKAVEAAYESYMKPPYVKQ